MKTVKIILAVLLLICLLPVSSCTLSFSKDANEYADHFRAPFDTIPQELQRTDALITAVTQKAAWAFFTAFIGTLSAAIVAIALRKKYYGGLIAGGLILIPYCINVSAQNSVRALAEHLHFSLEQGAEYWQVFNLSKLSLCVLLWFLPMVILFLLGIIETIIYIIKKRKGLLSSDNSQKNLANQTDLTSSVKQDSKIGELKELKELLDQGIITQEEFDAKKKQLLGL